MTEEEKIEARLEFIYNSAFPNNYIPVEKQEGVKSGMRQALKQFSVAELLHLISTPYLPAPFFEDSITTIRIPSGKMVFVGLNWDGYSAVSKQENVTVDFAIGRDYLCHIFAEKHNIAWTIADSDGTTHLVHNKNTNMLSIVDWSTLEQEDVVETHETVLSSLNCESLVYLVDYEQYLRTKEFNDYDGKIIVHDVEPGVYEYVVSSLKDDKDFTPGLFETHRNDYATLEWVSPL